MTQVKLVKLKLVEGKKKVWLDWCEELKARKKEVIETLKAEKVLSESCFISDDGEYIYYFMEAENFDHKNDKHFPIDDDHKEKRTVSLEKVAQLKELFHFENRS